MKHLTLVFALILCAECIRAAEDAGAPVAPSDRVRKHLSENAVTAIRAAKKVETFRVGALDYQSAGAEGTVGGRKLIGVSVPVSREISARLTAALMSDDTYFRADSKGTTVGVAYRLTAEDQSVIEISCCLRKGNVFMVLKDAKGNVTRKADLRGFRDDPKSPMRLIAAELFPDDREVQQCKPK